MSGVSKFTADRNQRILLDLLSKPGNDICADCKVRAPRWASHNLGIFICVNCASVHRKIGTHITKVKSVTMDSWSREQVEVMKSIGNVASNVKYNPDEARHPPPANREESERDSELEKFIRWKYEFKRFMDKPGSTSKTSAASSTLKVPPVRRPQSTPAASMARRSSPLPPLPTSSQSDSTTLLRASGISYSTSTSSAAPTPPIAPVAPPWQASASPHVPGSTVSPVLGSVPVWVPVIASPLPPAQAPALPSQSNSAPNHPIWNDMMSLANPGQQQQQPLQSFSMPIYPHLQPQPSVAPFQPPQQLYGSPSQTGGPTSMFGSSSVAGSGSMPTNPTSAMINNTDQFPTRSVSLPVLTSTGSSPGPFTAQNMDMNVNVNAQTPPGIGSSFSQQAQARFPGQMQMQMPINGAPTFQQSTSVPVAQQSPFGSQLSSPFPHSPYTPTPPSAFPSQQQQFMPSVFPQQYGQSSHMPMQPPQGFPQQQQQMQGQGGSLLGTSSAAWQQQPAGPPPYGSWGCI